jgi:hypothetical protein
MCRKLPHTSAKYVSAYILIYMCPQTHCYICVLIHTTCLIHLLNMCLHTYCCMCPQTHCYICVLIHTDIYVSEVASYICYICVRIHTDLYMASNTLLYMCPHTYCYICALIHTATSAVCKIRSLVSAIYVASYCYICVLILPHMCPHNDINVSSYCYICVHRLIYECALILLYGQSHIARAFASRPRHSARAPETTAVYGLKLLGHAVLSN